MMILRDTDLVDRIDRNRRPEGSSPLVSSLKKGKGWFKKSSPIQPTSIDLHIGRIFVPETEPHLTGGEKFPHEEYVLEPGKTALVETYETLNLPSDISGIGFPPSRVSVTGILMTNPGHVDPGFEGKLSFTIINMGKKPFLLKRRRMIFSVAFFKLEGAVHQDFKARRENDTDRVRKNKGNVRQRNIDALTRDFMNVENRIKKASDLEFKRAMFWVTIFGLVFGIYVNQKDGQFLERIKKVEDKVDKAELINVLQSNDNKIKSLQKQVEDLKQDNVHLTQQLVKLSKNDKATILEGNPLDSSPKELNNQK